MPVQADNAARGSLTLHPLVLLLYPFYVLCGILILYSLMISLAATGIWLGRNQSLYDFWFYITNFSRYPMEIYSGAYGDPLRMFFTFVIPVLIVVNVPARLMTRPLTPLGSGDWLLPAFAILATLGALAFSRWVFLRPDQLPQCQQLGSAPPSLFRTAPGRSTRATGLAMRWRGASALDTAWTSRSATTVWSVDDSACAS